MRQVESSSSNRGFSLIEVLAALVIGLAVVLGLGGLSERLIHHRATSNSNSAAMSLAERQLEVILGDPLQNPSGGTQCATVDTNVLCNGTHTAVSRAADGSTTNPAFRVQWTVADIAGTGSPGTEPLTIPTPALGVSAALLLKKVTITVTHLRNPNVNAQLVRYVRILPPA